MKKILAVLIALVLSLGLASVAFADVYGGVQLVNEAEDEMATYHVTPGLSESDTIIMWACFDGDTQSVEFVFAEETVAIDTDKISDHVLTKNGVPIAFVEFDGSKDVSAADQDAAIAALKASYKITQNAKYISSMVIDLAGEWYSYDTNDDATLDDSYTKIGASGDYEAAADTKLIFCVTGMTVSVLPIDPVIAENKLVKGYIYAWNNHALTTSYIWGCNFEIELRNHYVDVAVTGTDFGGIWNNGFVWNNASTQVNGAMYTAGHNDITDCITMEKPLILHRHYIDGNSSTEPSYVIYTEQFATVSRVLTPFSVTYTGLVTVKIADAKIQDGINFKYYENSWAMTDAMRYLNPTAEYYTFEFPSAAVLESKTTVTLLNVDGIADALKYDDDDKTQPVYCYYSADGETWNLIFSGDLVKATGLEYTLEAGSVLGSYIVSNVELVFAAAEDGKDNVGTGASDMVSVAVALAVVSLVAAGAVCIKKVSK